MKRPDRVETRRAGAWWLATALCAVAAAVLLSVSKCGQVPADDATTGGATTPAVEPIDPAEPRQARPTSVASRQPLPAAVAESQPIANDVQWWIRDASGIPVADASACLVPARLQRRFATPDASVLGRSDRDGRVEMLGNALRGAGGVMIWKAGFEPHGELPPFAPRKDIVLQRGRTLVVRCLSSEGTPLPGVRLWLSRCVLPPAAYLETVQASGIRPAIADASAMWAGESKADGTVEIRGLPEGIFQAEATVYGFMSGTGLADSQVTMDKDVVFVDARFVPLFGCVARVRGDTVLSRRSTIARVLAVSLPERARCADAARIIRARTGADIAECRPWERDPGVRIEYTLLLARRGWVTQEIPLRRIADVRVPDVIDADALGAARYGTVKFVVEKVPENQDADRPSGILVHPVRTGPGHQAGTFDVRHGSTHELPAGSYRVSLRLLGGGVSESEHVLDAPLVVTHGSEQVYVVRPPPDRTHCRLRAVDRSGVPVRGISLLLRRPDRSNGAMSTTPLDGVIDGWLRVGMISITGSGFGWQRVRVDEDVVHKPGTHEIAVTFVK